MTYRSMTTWRHCIWNYGNRSLQRLPKRMALSWCDWRKGTQMSWMRTRVNYTSTITFERLRSSSSKNNATCQDKHAKPTAKDIKNAYHKLAMRHHPDRPTGDKKQFQKIQAAYAILINPVLRKKYDMYGFPGIRSHYHKKAEDTEGGGILAALFSFIGFGQGGGRR